MNLSQRRKQSSYLLIKLFFIFSLLSGCSDRPEIIKQGKAFKIKVLPATIQNVIHKKWHVGKSGRDIVSKGMRIHMKLPQFDHTELKSLLQEGFVDSLLVRLKKKTYSESATLDTFYINLGRKQGHNEKEYLITQLREINLHVLYNAASVDRLARLRCPAMNHRYLIDDFDINSSMMNESNYVINAKTSYPDHISDIRLYRGSKHTIKGGKSFIGSYYLEMAFYNSLKRRRVGHFLPASEVLKIEEEERVEIPFCDKRKNKNGSQADDVRSFRFGR